MSSQELDSMYKYFNFFEVHFDCYLSRHNNSRISLPYERKCVPSIEDSILPSGTDYLISPLLQYLRRCSQCEIRVLSVGVNHNVTEESHQVIIFIKNS